MISEGASVSISDEQLRAWKRLKFSDPVPVLQHYRSVERQVAVSNLRDKAKRLRTPMLKGVREGRDAALFTHGMATATGRKVFFAPVEGQDYDFVTCWEENDEGRFCAVQLKELVPTDLNPGATFEGLLEGLAKYSKSETVLAILLNRPFQANVSDLRLDTVPFSQLWLFWQSSSDGNRWAVQGDVLKAPTRYDFEYPS